MDVQIPEAVRQRPLLPGVDGLIPQEQHLILQQGAMELLEVLLRQGLGQGETGDLGADVGPQRGNRQLVVHMLSPCQGVSRRCRARKPSSNTKAM
ncbi:hypothetical protein D3C78_1747430 [compost metagenome]